MVIEICAKCPGGPPCVMGAGAGVLPFHFLNGHIPATAVLLLKPPCGGFRSETATWVFRSGLKYPLEILLLGSSSPRYKRFLRRRAETTGVAIEYPGDRRTI